jgi:hypothetical protein
LPCLLLCMDKQTQSHNPKLLDQLRNALRVKHYSYRTGKSYIYRVRRFIYFHNLKHPREMDAYELRAFFNPSGTA